MSVIEFENVDFSYPGDDYKSLDGVSVKIEKGEFVAVLGHNGSGKSTFAKHMNAILVPDSGKVTVFGMDTSDEDKAIDIRRRVGMVFQNPDNQLVSTVVEEDVAFGPENLGIAPDEIRRRVDESLAAVSMSEYARFAPHKLSGGQKQRVAIAGILAMMPDCIIFDESTAMLDPMGRRDVMKIMKMLNREKKITIITITHNMEEAVLADRVVVLDDGKIKMDGSPSRIFSQVDRLHSMGLAVPQSAELIYRLKSHNLPLPADIIDEESAVDAISSLLGKPEIQSEN